MHDRRWLSERMTEQLGQKGSQWIEEVRAMESELRSWRAVGQGLVSIFPDLPRRHEQAIEWIAKRVAELENENAHREAQRALYAQEAEKDAWIEGYIYAMDCSWPAGELAYRKARRGEDHDA